mgnify:CR=1 FL=1
MNAKTLKRVNLKNGKKLFKKLKEPGNSLTEKTLKGGFWVFGLRITDRIFGLIRTIILARLLSPNDFGVFGIALLALSALDTFSQTGFKQALIQKKEETKDYLNTTWTVGVIRALFIAVILFFLAPLAANFFETPAVEPILKVIGISIILQGLTNIAVLYFEKELEFQKFFKYQFLGTITDVVVSITAAFLLKNVWALVFGLLAGNLVRCIMSYVIDKYRPKIQLNKNQAKELFNFGKWIMGSSIMMFFLTEGDDILIGKILGATMLGFYQMAYKISNLPATEITHVISQVTFPAYSKLQDNIPKLKEAYLKVLQVTAFLSFPIAGLIFVLAPDFTQIFLGEKWMPMVPAMQILCIFGTLRAFNATTGPIFQAVGKPSILTKISLIQLIFLGVIIYPFTTKGNLAGVSWAVTLSNSLCFILSFQKILEITKETRKNIVSVVVPPALVTTGIMCLIHLLKIIMLNKTSLFTIFILSILLSLTIIYLIYGKILGFSFSSFFNSGNFFKKKYENK